MAAVSSKVVPGFGTSAVVPVGHAGSDDGVEPATMQIVTPLKFGKLVGFVHDRCTVPSSGAIACGLVIAAAGVVAWTDAAAAKLPCASCANAA